MASNPYKPSDLIYSDYKNSAVFDYDDPDITGFPDSSRFDRHEKFEMLHFINSVAKKHGWGTNLTNYQKLELMLHNHLPSEIMGHDKVYRWAVESWEKF